MGLVNKPYTFMGDTPAIASEVNANFDAILAVLNGQVDAANLKPVTVDQTLEPTANTAGLYLLLSWFANMLWKMNGGPEWKSDPATTLKALADFMTTAQAHIDDTENPHGVTAAQAGATAAQNGGENIWVQSTEPTAQAVGDIWIETD